jgi:D-alanyl-D-alanine endopeptidase (penicillin-binding protein 7)
MDAQTGEVLYSKNSNTVFPIASITKLMTAVVTSDARLNMSEEITLQQIDFAGAGGKNSSSTLRAGDTESCRSIAVCFNEV